MAEYDWWDRQCIELERVEKATTVADLPEFLSSSYSYIRRIAKEKLERFQREDDL